MNKSEEAKKLYAESIVMDLHFAIEMAMPGNLDEKWALVDTYASAGVAKWLIPVCSFVLNLKD